MLEMALTHGILRLLEEQAATHGFSRVKTIWLEAGGLTEGDRHSLTFAFRAASVGTLAEGAELSLCNRPGGPAGLRLTDLEVE